MAWSAVSDEYHPVDVYIPGCPPTRKPSIFGLMKLHEKVERQSVAQVPWYRKDQSELIPVPILGPDIFDPRQVQLIREYTLGAGAAQTDDVAGGLVLKPNRLSAEQKQRLAEIKRLHGQQTAGLISLFPTKREKRLEA